jgi:hypothetical protein
MVFRVMVARVMKGGYQPLGETHCLHLQDLYRSEYLYPLLTRWDSSASTVNRLWLGRPRKIVRFSAWARDISLLHSAQTEAHQAPYPLGTGGSQ